MRSILTLLMVWLFGITSVHAASCDAADGAPVLTLFLTAGEDESDAWFRSLSVITKAAAANYGFDLRFVNMPVAEQEGMALIAEHIESVKPDAALVVSERTYTGQIIEKLSDNKIYTAIAISPLNELNRQLVGRPTEQNSHFVVSITPDDEQAGYDMANSLLEMARARGAERPIRVIGITGKQFNPVSRARVKGLEQAVQDAEDADLLQVAAADWNPDKASRKSRLMAIRYGDVDVAWVANDDMAMGVIDALGQRKGVVVGGFDWTDLGRAALTDGRLGVTYGGHTMDIVFAVSILADHVRGRVSETDHVTREFISHMQGLTAGNESQYEELYQKMEGCDVNFTPVVGRVFDEAVDGVLSTRRFLEGL